MSKMYDQLTANDECYTPRYAVEPLLKYLPTNSTIWCPFDTEKSEFVIAFREAGHKVIHSHIFEGKDYFTYEPEESYDYIISNPPFRNKRLYVERAIALGKAFALLLPTTWLNDTAPFNLGVPLDILMFDKRINFGKSGISFKTNYFSHGLLPDNYIVERLDTNKVKSRMWEDFDKIKRSFEEDLEDLF